MAEEKDLDEETTVIEFTDEAGHTLYYEEELVFAVGDTQFAVLVALLSEEGEPQDDEEAIIAKIIENEAGEAEYIDPTDEEFALAEKAYNDLLDAEEK